MTKPRRRPPNRVRYSADGIPYCPRCALILCDSRSLAHLGLLFAFIKYIFDKWEELEKTSPDEGEQEELDKFFPTDEEHLRAFLFVKVGWVKPYDVLPLGTKKERSLALDILNMQMNYRRARREYGWPREVAGGVAVLEPASIAVYGDERIGEFEFIQLTEKVFNFINDRFGVNIDLWKETHKRGKGSGS